MKYGDYWAEFVIAADGSVESLTFIDPMTWWGWTQSDPLGVTIAPHHGGPRWTTYWIEWACLPSLWFRRIALVDGWDLLQDGHLISSEDWRGGLEGAIAATELIHRMAHG